MSLVRNGTSNSASKNERTGLRSPNQVLCIESLLRFAFCSFTNSSELSSSSLEESCSPDVLVSSFYLRRLKWRNKLSFLQLLPGKCLQPNMIANLEWPIDTKSIVRLPL